MTAYRRGRGSLFYQPRHKTELLWEFSNWNRNPYISLHADGVITIKLLDGVFESEGFLDPCELTVVFDEVFYHQIVPPCASRETLIRDVFEPLDRWVNAQSVECPPPNQQSRTISFPEFRQWLEGL